VDWLLRLLWQAPAVLPRAVGGDQRQPVVPRAARLGAQTLLADLRLRRRPAGAAYSSLRTVELRMHDATGVMRSAELS
jgi:hypothetical protein